MKSSRQNLLQTFLLIIINPLRYPCSSIHNLENMQPTLAQLEERETVMDKIILRSPVRARQVGRNFYFSFHQDTNTVQQRSHRRVSIQPMQLQPGTSDGIVKPLFALLPVDYIPDHVEILITGQTGICRHIYTHNSPGIEVLQIVRVLPDVDPNDGHVSEKRVLVCRSGDFKALCPGIPTLPKDQWLKRTQSWHARANPNQNLEWPR